MSLSSRNNDGMILIYQSSLGTRRRFPTELVHLFICTKTESHRWWRYEYWAIWNLATLKSKHIKLKAVLHAIKELMILHRVVSLNWNYHTLVLCMMPKSGQFNDAHVFIVHPPVKVSNVPATYQNSRLWYIYICVNGIQINVCRADQVNMN